MDVKVDQLLWPIARNKHTVPGRNASRLRLLLAVCRYGEQVDARPVDGAPRD